MNSFILVDKELIEVKPKNYGVSLRKAMKRGDVTVLKRINNRRHNIVPQTGCICMVCGKRNQYDEGICNMEHDAWLEPYDVRMNTLWYRQMLNDTYLSAEEFNKRFWDNKVLEIPIINRY